MEFLNRHFCQLNGPAEYIYARLLSLTAWGGAYEALKNIFSEPVEFVDLRLNLCRANPVL